MDRNALDWLFSTAPQALAALVGLIFTGVAFIHGAIDKAIAKDDTSAYIFEEMKLQIHRYMKSIFICAGIAIALDLFFIVLNPIENDLLFSFDGAFDSYLLGAGFLFILNLFTIGYSLYFVLLVANPNYFRNTVKRLSMKLREGDVEAMDFLKEFRNMEAALRDLPINFTSQGQQQPAMSEMLGRLKQLAKFGKEDIDRLYELNRLRNLVSHNTEINYVEREAYNDVLDFTRRIIKLKDEL